MGQKSFLKINANGELVQYNESLRIWEVSNKSWTWADISKGYKRESKRNYKAHQ